MKKLLGNIFFWMGDKTCAMSIKFNSPFLWDLYQRLMNWSDRLKPWENVKESYVMVDEQYQNPMEEHSSPLTGFLVCVALGFFITVGFIWVMVKIWT